MITQQEGRNLITPLGKRAVFVSYPLLIDGANFRIARSLIAGTYYVAAAPRLLARSAYITLTLKVPDMKTRLALLAVALVACSGSKVVNPIVYVGTYDLVSINGLPLPASSGDDGGNHYVAVSGNTILRADKSFTKNHLIITYNSSNVQTATTPEVYNGTYAIDGNNISFNYPANGAQPAHSVTGVIDAGSIVQESVGRVWRFERK